MSTSTARSSADVTSPSATELRDSSPAFAEENRWALVTGASAGIGAEFSRQLAALGYQLVLVARREDRLHALAAVLRDDFRTNCLVCPLDLASPGATTRLAYSEFHDVSGTRELVSRMPDWMWMGAEEVVRYGLDSVMGQSLRVVAIPGHINRLIARMMRCLPTSVTLWMSRRMSRRFRAQKG